MGVPGWLCAMVLGCSLAAQTVMPESPSPSGGPSKAALPERWGQLRRVSQLLQTDDGVQILLRESPEIESNYSNRDYFMDFVHKWRERVPVLPERIEVEATDLFSWDVTNADGIQRVYLTIYHQGSPDSFTIMRTTWRSKEMIDLFFMRGTSSPYTRGTRGADGPAGSYRKFRRP